MFLCKHRLKETEGNKSIRTSEYVDKEKKERKKERTQIYKWKSVTEGTENANNDNHGISSRSSSSSRCDGQCDVRVDGLACGRCYAYIPYFSIDNAHLMYNAHPKLFRHSY
jgi:hypothetical protein